MDGARAHLDWFHGFGLRRRAARLTREQRHEPFTPSVPDFFRDHPLFAGTVLAVAGIASITTIVRNMESWPDWMLFPGMLLSVPALAAMMLGLGIVTVRALEPAIALMDPKWDAEPLNALGLPPPLQRKCEQLGYWAVEDLAESIDRGRFSWIALEYDERMQLERTIQRWRVAVAAEQQSGKRRRGVRQRRSSGHR
jgi:hypothetical protein